MSVPAESSTSIPHRASSADDPPRNRRIGRDKGRGLAGRLQRLAHRDRERQAFFSLVVGDHDCDALKRGGKSQRRQRPPPLAPEIGRLGGTERFAQEGGARLKRRRGRAESRDILAPNPDRANQPMQQRLWMARKSERDVLAGADHRPRAIVEIEVETRQHDGALRRARNRRDEAGGRPIGSGGARDDGRTASRSLERLDLVLDQERDPLRPVDEAALGQPVRPTGEGDLEEIEGDAPIGIIKIRRERFEPCPRRALDDHVVDQRGQIASKRVSLRGRGRDQRRLGRIDDELPVGVGLANCAF